MSRIRILLADDHMLIRMGISSLVTTANDMEIVGEAKNGRQAVELADSLRPDVVIMDLMMPKMPGSEAIRLIHNSHPEIKVIVLTSFATSKEMSEAIANGASGALMKDSSSNNLIAAIRAIVAGKRIIPDELLRQAEEDNAIPSLSKRHLEMLASVAQGQSNADIALQFGLSEITVKKHLSAIFERLGVANRSEAVSLAFRKQMLKV